MKAWGATCTAKKNTEPRKASEEMEMLTSVDARDAKKPVALDQAGTPRKGRHVRPARSTKFK